jgi:hypothetical protein
MNDKIAMINEVFIGLEVEDQDALLNEIVEKIHKDRVLKLEALVDERNCLLNRAEIINGDISKLKKHIEKLNIPRIECASEECDAPEQKPSDWAIGKHVKIDNFLYGHKFEINQVVEIVGYNNERFPMPWLCSDGQHQSWIAEDEATLV